MPRFLIYLCCFILVTKVIAQQENGVTYLPAQTKSYGIEEGLPDPCVAFAHIDSLGRMTIEPCSHAQITYNLPFYQIDGNGARFLDFSEAPRANYRNFRTLGVTADDINYGVIVESQAFLKFYTYNLIDGSLKIYDLPQRFENLIALGNVIYNNGKFELLCYNREQYHIAELIADSVQIKRSFPNPHKQLLIGGMYPFLKTEKEYVFSDGYTIYRTKEEHLEILDHNPNYQYPSSLVPFQKFYKFKNGILVYGADVPRTVFYLDLETKERRDYHEFLPKKYLGPIVNTLIYDDEVGNLLTVLQYEDNSIRSFLMEKNGSISDYSTVNQKFRHTDFSHNAYSGLHGKDFRKQIIQAAYNFEVIDVTSSQGISNVDIGPQRGIVELQDGSLFLRSNKKVTIKNKELSVIDNAIEGTSENKADDFILRIDEDRLLIPHSRSIDVYNEKSDSFTTFELEDLVIRSQPLKNRESIFIIKLNGACEIDLATGTVQEYDLHDPPGFISQIVENGNELLFVSNEGIFKSEFGEDNAIKFSRVDSKLNIAANMMAVDGQGRYWIATFAQGLHIYDPKTGILEVIDEKKGLSNNTVATLIQDNDGDFWIGTFNGLTIIDESLDIIGHVYESDGLNHNECNRWSVTKMENGGIVFGSVKGLSIVDPAVYKQKLKSAPKFQIYLSRIRYQDSIELTDISILNSSLDENIFLPASNRNLTVNYGVSDYTNPEGAQYAYKLESKNDNWNYVGNVDELALIDLPRGEYNLVIKGANHRGRQSVNQLVIPLHVGSYFYQTVWFYICCILIVLAMVAAWIKRQKRIQRMLEEEVEKRTSTILRQKEELEQLDQFKSKLYTNITHEFRTPLTVINGLADQIKEDPKAPELIKRNTRNLLGLVNQMLDLRKLESSKMELNLIQSDILQYAKYIGESFGSIAHSKQIKIQYDFPEGELVMDFDPEKLTRILGNLVSNAIKYTPENGKVEICAKTKEEWLELTVSDNGVGIPADQVDKIFDQYYQIENEWTRTGVGTGIGLALVYELIQLLGGKIQVESTEHVGSKFIVMLPITKEADFKERIAKESVIKMTSAIPVASSVPMPEIAEEEPSNKPTILLVEDNPDVLHYLILCIKDHYKIKIAHNGKEGLTQALKWMPSIIVSDVMMPEMTGYELCEVAKSDIRLSHIPIVLLTAKADQDSKIKGLKKGADEYLSKPFQKEELLVRLRNLIHLQSALHTRYTTFSELSEGTNELKTQEDKFILDFRSLILKEMENERFGIPEMCKALGMGKTQLHEKIKTLTGKSPIQYQRMIKLHEAKILLETSDATISEIAFNLGFKDPKYFSKVFKETYGESPSSFARTT